MSGQESQCRMATPFPRCIGMLDRAGLRKRKLRLGIAVPAMAHTVLALIRFILSCFMNLLLTYSAVRRAVIPAQKINILLLY